MGFDVHYQGDIGAMGGVANSAGLGQYRLVQQRRADAINAQNRAIQANEKAQKRQIAAQEQSQLMSIYSNMAMRKNDREFTLQRDEDQYNRKVEYGDYLRSQGKEDEAVEMERLEEQKTLGMEQDKANFVQNGWMETVEGLNNFKDFSTSDRKRFEEIKAGMAELGSNEALTQDQKIGGMSKLINEVKLMDAQTIPREQTREEKQIADGKGPGDIWVADDGNSYTMKNGEAVKVNDASKNRDGFSKTTAKIIYDSDLSIKDDWDRIYARVSGTPPPEQKEYPPFPSTLINAVKEEFDGPPQMQTDQPPVQVTTEDRSSLPYEEDEIESLGTDVGQQQAGYPALKSLGFSGEGLNLLTDEIMNPVAVSKLSAWVQNAPNTEDGNKRKEVIAELLRDKINEYYNSKFLTPR